MIDNVHLLSYSVSVSWNWKPEKNDRLKELKRPCFEDVLQALEKGGFRDILANSNYPDQRLLVVMIFGYIHIVPFKMTKGLFFLFTIYPSRVYQKKYGGK